MTEEELLERMEKEIPFPEHIFSNMAEKERELVRASWSGNPEKFLQNLQKTLGIEIAVPDPITGAMTIRRLNKGG
jgi:hypothetical protein